jgi:hypothetical protein
MFSTTDNNNEGQNSLATGGMLNFLNGSVRETVLLMPAIILKDFVCVQNSLLSVECPQKIIPCDTMEQKQAA